MLFKNFMIILLISLISISFLTSCSSNTGSLGLSVNFPKSSPILNKNQKEELNKKIKIKNSEIFTSEELAELEIIIK